MTRVAPVKLKNNHRVLWFDPAEVDAHKGDPVVVNTARGLELGTMSSDVIEVEEKRVKELKSPLKPLERVADEDDMQRAAEMERLSAEALPVFKQMAAEANEDMHPVSVEYLLDGEHAVFYFEAEERIDFRDLVRKLASHFHVRVDMRQIGVRDEARMVGGMGHCGQELCCKRLGGEFCPVSIRMAKEQDLSLNPQKISGVCGRLMCCLRYEFEAYKDFKQRAPKKNASIETPEGTAKVVELNVPREMVSLKTEEGQVVKVPLTGFEPAKDGVRPNEVAQEAWDKATAPKDFVAASQLFSSTQQLSGKDKLAEPGSVRHTGHSQNVGGKKRSSSKSNQHDSTDTRKPRRRSKVSSSADSAPSPQERAKKRGQVKVQGKKPEQAKQADQIKHSDQKKRSGQTQKSRRRQAEQDHAQQKGSRQKDAQHKQQSARPGRKSSALRQGGAQRSPQEPRRKQPTAQSSGEGAGRRSRRRSHKARGHEESPSGNSSAQS